MRWQGQPVSRTGCITKMIWSSQRYNRVLQIITCSFSCIPWTCWQCPLQVFSTVQIRALLRVNMKPVDDVHEFYNVLWIERDKDGVARRQGRGRIFKEAWDLEVGDEKVEVILK
jgi:hypothetical protein